jgi:hypothetical protein
MAMRLFRELHQQGYTGSYARVAAVPALDARRATWFVLRCATQRTEAETQQLTQLHA